MRGLDAFKIWAPAGARWVDWARPVPFAAMHNTHPLHKTASFTIPDIFYTAKAQGNMAVILDMPGYDSVPEGIAFAKMGFRPVPLYNGAKAQEGAMALVEYHGIERALLWGASELAEIAIPPDAPPVFLLDSNRTHQYKMNASVFDNSWDLYSQDMPSAEYFLNNGIDHILVRGDAVQKDIARILYPFQKKGITIFFADGYDHAKKVIIKRPPRMRG